REWNCHTGEQTGTLTGHESSITSLVFSRDGKTLVSGDITGTIRLWDGAERKSRGILARNQSRVAAISFSPDVRLLAGGSAVGTICLWKIPSQNEYEECPIPSGHKGSITSVAVSPD